MSRPNLPTTEGAARKLLGDLDAPRALRAHAEITLGIAKKLLRTLERRVERAVFDRDLVYAGCLLHDVGKIFVPLELCRPGVAHESAGYIMLLREGADELLASMCHGHRWFGGLGSSSLERQLVAIVSAMATGRRDKRVEGELLTALGQRGIAADGRLRVAFTALTNHALPEAPPTPPRPSVLPREGLERDVGGAAGAAALLEELGASRALLERVRARRRCAEWLARRFERMLEMPKRQLVVGAMLCEVGEILVPEGVAEDPEAHHLAGEALLLREGLHQSVARLCRSSAPSFRGHRSFGELLVAVLYQRTSRQRGAFPLSLREDLGEAPVAAGWPSGVDEMLEDLDALAASTDVPRRPSSSRRPASRNARLEVLLDVVEPTLLAALQEHLGDLPAVRLSLRALSRVALEDSAVILAAGPDGILPRSFLRRLPDEQSRRAERILSQQRPSYLCAKEQVEGLPLLLLAPYGSPQRGPEVLCDALNVAANLAAEGRIDQLVLVDESFPRGDLDVIVDRLRTKLEVLELTPRQPSSALEVAAEPRPRARLPRRCAENTNAICLGAAREPALRWGGEVEPLEERDDAMEEPEVVSLERYLESLSRLFDTATLSEEHQAPWLIVGQRGEASLSCELTLHGPWAAQSDASSEANGLEVRLDYRLGDVELIAPPAAGEGSSFESWAEAEEALANSEVPSATRTLLREAFVSWPTAALCWSRSELRARGSTRRFTRIGLRGWLAHLDALALALRADLELDIDEAAEPAAPRPRRATSHVQPMRGPSPTFVLATPRGDWVGPLEELLRLDGDVVLERAEISALEGLDALVSPWFPGAPLPGWLERVLPEPLHRRVQRDFAEQSSEAAEGESDDERRPLRLDTGVMSPAAVILIPEPEIPLHSRNALRWRLRQLRSYLHEQPASKPPLTRVGLRVRPQDIPIARAEAPLQRAVKETPASLREVAPLRAFGAEGAILMGKEHEPLCALDGATEAVIVVVDGARRRRRSASLVLCAGDEALQTSSYPLGTDATVLVHHGLAVNSGGRAGGGVNSPALEVRQEQTAIPLTVEAIELETYLDAIVDKLAEHPLSWQRRERNLLGRDDKTEALLDFDVRGCWAGEEETPSSLSLALRYRRRGVMSINPPANTLRVAWNDCPWLPAPRGYHLDDELRAEIWAAALENARRSPFPEPCLAALCELFSTWPTEELILDDEGLILRGRTERFTRIGLRGWLAQTEVVAELLVSSVAED